MKSGWPEYQMWLYEVKKNIFFSPTTALNFIFYYFVCVFLNGCCFKLCAHYNRSKAEIMVGI